MSEFANLLSDYIRQKGYSIRGLAQHLGMPSTTLTKLCNSTRSAKNQSENIQRICDVLMLTPAQREKLTAAFEAELIGVNVYNSRMSVKKLVESMYCRRQPARHSGAKGAPLPALSLTEKESDSYTMIRSFFDNACDEGGTLDMLFAPDNVVVMEMLRNVVASYPVRIRHIVSMLVSDHSTGMVSSQNIDTVQKILPLILGGGDRESTYIPYYYYEHAVGSGNDLQFPNVMISAHGVLCCTADYIHCIYSEEKSMLRYFGRLFEHQLTQCRPLISVEKDCPGQLKRFTRLAEMSEGSRELISVSWQPCLVQCVTPADVESNLSGNTGFRKELIRNYLHYLKCLSGRKKIDSYFTQEGLVDFAKTGCLRELPKEILGGGTVPYPLRRLLFHRLIQYAEAGTLHLHIAKENAFNIARDAQIIYYGADTVSVAGLSYDSDGRICFLEELSTNWSVLDFLENLQDANLFLSEAESLAAVTDVLHDYLQEPPKPPAPEPKRAAKATTRHSVSVM